MRETIFTYKKDKYLVFDQKKTSFSFKGSKQLFFSHYAKKNESWELAKFWYRRRQFASLAIDQKVCLKVAAF